MPLIKDLLGKLRSRFVSDRAFRENLDRQLVMTPQTLSELRASGVSFGSERRLFMCRLGFEHDCDFDGWGTYVESLAT